MPRQPRSHCRGHIVEVKLPQLNLYQDKHVRIILSPLLRGLLASARGSGTPPCALSALQLLPKRGPLQPTVMECIHITFAGSCQDCQGYIAKDRLSRSTATIQNINMFVAFVLCLLCQDSQGHIAEDTLSRSNCHKSYLSRF